MSPEGTSLPPSTMTLAGERKEKKRGSRREEQSAADNGQRSVYCTTEYSVCVYCSSEASTTAADKGRQTETALRG